MITFFIQVIGNFLSGSGFEDMVFQSGMMKSGFIKGILLESDYNHAYIVHVMSKALERLLLTRFLTEVSGVNMFTTRNAISYHISPMIKGVEYPFYW